MKCPRLVIALSMMVVAAAVPDNPAMAADVEGSASALPSEAATDATADPSSAGDATPSRRAKRASGRAAEPAAVPESKFGGPATNNHRLQTGLSIMPGTGYRLIVPYKDATPCGDRSGSASKRVCANFVPAFLDFQLSFGATSRLDAIVDVRFGLQEDPAVKGNRQFALAPGMRFWLDQDVALKFYTTLQFVFDYTNFSSSPGVRSSDFGARNASGLMYDPIRNVGFFVQFAETFGFVRWFRIDLDVGLGAQIRFP